MAAVQLETHRKRDSTTNKERLDGPHIWLEGEHVSKAWLPDLFNPESLLSVDKENYLSWLL